LRSDTAVATTPTAQAAPSPVRGRLSSVLKQIWRDRECYLFLAPFGIIFTVFTVVPVVMSIFLSFTYFNMLQPARWVGIHNYVRLFLEDDVFLIAVRNTLLYASITGPLSYLLCFILAWFINDLKPKVRAVLALLFYAPSISGNAFMVWTLIFSGDTYGLLNGLLIDLGIIHQPIQWLLEPAYIMPIVIVVVLWMSLGTSFLVFIAGLQGLDPRLFESGAIDGIKNRWQELWYLTLPQMKGHLMFGAIMSITGSFTAASQITQLVGEQLTTDYAAHTIMQHLQDYGTVRFDMGYACSIAVVLFFAMVVSQRLVQKLLDRVGR
jgi:multiple sugar transport system permease protein